MATFAENTLSIRDLSASVGTLTWQHDRLTDLVQTPAGETSEDLKARQRLVEIKLHLAKANEYFYAREFGKALDEYLVTQGLVYALVQPSFERDVTGHPELILPLQEALFNPLLKVGLNMVDKFTLRKATDAFGSTTVELPSEVRKQTEAFTNLGVSVSTPVSDEVHETALLGVQAANQGKWAQAQYFFQLGLRNTEAMASAAAEPAKASLRMNLGVVTLQAGDPERAQLQLNAALAGFLQTEDLVGQAQATLNLAAAATKQGNLDEAQALKRNAAELLAKAEGRPLPPDGQAGAPVPVPTTDPKSLTSLLGAGAAGVSLRLPGTAEGWVVQDLASNIENAYGAGAKQAVLGSGSAALTVEWEIEGTIDEGSVLDGMYRPRIERLDPVHLGLRFDLDAGFAAKLPHLYFFVLPVAIGDCHHHLGAFPTALDWYSKAATYRFINVTAELPSVWQKAAQNYLAWGNDLYKQAETPAALDAYSYVIRPDGEAPAGSPLYQGAYARYGDLVKEYIATLPDDAAETLSPKTISIVIDVRNKLRMIEAGLDFWGFSTNFFPIFKFDYLQSIAAYFAQQAAQAEREYINFTVRGQDEQLTREQLNRSVEMGKAEVDLAAKQVEQSEADRDVVTENAELAALRLANAQQHRAEYADVSYELTALEAASVFAAGPEGYSVSYTYYSPSEGKNVTLSGSDAYKVMEDAAWRRGMLSRELELANLDRAAAELAQGKEVADAQVAATSRGVEVARERQRVAELQQAHAESLLASFEAQTFTPEVWFQLGEHMRWLSQESLARALSVAKKMQQAYELETGFRLTAIQPSYSTNIVSGLLSADYLLKDIDYFTVHRIMNVRSKDIPIKQQLSLAALNPIGFETTFKSGGLLEFETSDEAFDLAYPGSYLRKIKKVEVIIEGLLPPGGINGTLKNSGISRDRMRDGAQFFRIQPKETLFLSDYSPRNDVVVFQPDPRMLEVFEHCGVATGWTLHLPPDANDVNYYTISDVKMIIYYTAQHSEELEAQVRASLPARGANSTSIPVRLLFPDQFFGFFDTGTLTVALRDSDFAYNQTDLTVTGLAVQLSTQPGTSAEGVTLQIGQQGVDGSAFTDATGLVRADAADPANPLNVLLGGKVARPWTITVPEAENPDFVRSGVRDIFLFLEYRFTYRRP
ncbi:hypothetical protein AB0H77_31235 [Streptomyces sp. NPDC050844]|uniref:Tc toxin subunit A-related protein n=1 Tax=Streptomyces sp. NPDC050844 TaxID=3155790 RepID=UPI003406D079